MRTSHRHYWTADAVLSLFLRDKHTDELLGLLQRKGPVYTSSATVAEFRLGVLKATAEHCLRPRTGDEVRQAFADSIQRGYIILLDEPALTNTEALPVAARPHITGLGAQAFRDLAAAAGGGFRYFVTRDVSLAAISRDWGLTAPNLDKLPAMDSFKSRLDRCRHLASELVAFSDELRAAVDALQPDELPGENEALDDACRNLADEIDVDYSPLESLIFDIEDALKIDSDDSQNGT